MYFPSINLIWASSAGKEPKIIKIGGKNIHCKKTVIFLRRFTPFGILGNSIVDKIAEATIPTKEIVIILPVKIGKLKDKIEKLNLFPPRSIGNHPKINKSKAAVAQDQ